MVESKERDSMINFIPTVSRKLINRREQTCQVEEKGWSDEVLQKPKQTNFKEGSKRRSSKKFYSYHILEHFNELMGSTALLYMYHGKLWVVRLYCRNTTVYSLKPCNDQGTRYTDVLYSCNIIIVLKNCKG